MIVYKGPSKLNGKPIIAVITEGSTNRKTGNMDQLWILPQRVSPVKSVKTGYDASVCGECPLRPSKGGPCYVNVGHAPQGVWKATKGDKYPDNTALKASRRTRRSRVRLGAWGDPAALPVDVLKGIAAMYQGHVGYTHQWRTCDPEIRGILMASTETEKSQDEAEAMGWRTFRVVKKYSQKRANERICASDSHGVQCIDCMACHGGAGAGIVIEVHGSLASRYGKMLEVMAELELALAS